VDNHGDDFDTTSPEDYATQANNFYQKALTEKLATIEYPNGGELGIYEPATNTFGLNECGVTLT